MYLLFLDESGTPPPSLSKAHGQKYLVIGGPIIPAVAWRSVADRLRNVKLRNGLDGEIKWRFFSPHNVDADNPMRELPFENRDRIRTEILRIVNAVSSIRIIASIASLPAAFSIPTVNGSDDLYRLTYQAVSERFQYYLQDLTHQTGREQYGLIVSDHHTPETDRGLRACHQRFVSTRGSYAARYTNLVETIFFTPSHLSPGIQLADVIAGSIWRWYERNDGRSFRLIEPSLRRSSDGRIDGYGLTRVPKQGWI